MFKGISFIDSIMLIAYGFFALGAVYCVFTAIYRVVTGQEISQEKDKNSPIGKYMVTTLGIFIAIMILTWLFDTLKIIAIALGNIFR